MFHMLSSFNLKPDVTELEFRQLVEKFHAELHARGLVQATGAIGRRQRHPVMDTNEASAHEYFFVMSFEDRAQCDRAVEFMYRHDGGTETAHSNVFAAVADPLFTCWEDIGES